MSFKWHKHETCPCVEHPNPMMMTPHRNTIRPTLLRRTLLQCLPGLACTGAHAAEPSSAEIQWVGGDLPPFVWQANGKGTGYAHDLAMELSRRLGRNEPVRFLPWARAVRMTAIGEPLGIFPLARTPDREASFRWLIPLMRVHYGLFVRAQDRPEWTIDTLRTARVVVLRGSPIGQHLKDAQFTNVIDATHYWDMLRMLDEGLVQAVYAGAPMLKAAMRESQRDSTQYREAGRLGEATLYMACALSIPQAESQRWIDAFNAAEADGTVARLRQRYGLN